MKKTTEVDAVIFSGIMNDIAELGISRSEYATKYFETYKKKYSLSDARAKYTKKNLIEGTSKDIEDLVSGRRGIHKVMTELEKPKKRNIISVLMGHLHEKKGACVNKSNRLVPVEKEISCVNHDLPIVKEHHTNDAIKILLTRFGHVESNDSKGILHFADVFEDLKLHRQITLDDYEEFIEILKVKINSMSFWSMNDRTLFYDKFEKYGLIIRKEPNESYYSIFQMMKLK